MKCPNCEEEFGYLHLEEKVKEGDHYLFSCPHCSCHLSSAPISRSSRKQMVLFVSAGVLLLVIVAGIDMLNVGVKFGIIATWIGVSLSGLLLLIGYLEVRRFSSLSYDRASG